MRIVHIEDFIHPDAGYQPNVLSKLQTEQGHELFIVTSELDKMPDYLTSFFGKDDIEEKDRKFYERTGVKIIRVPIIAYYSGRSIYTHKLFEVVDSLNPDIAFVHGEDTLVGIQFILRYKKQKYPMIMDCHMLEMASENKLKHVFRFFYKKFITPLILKHNIPIVRVVDSDYVEKCLGIPLEKTNLFPLGTDINYFKPDEMAKKEMRLQNNIDENDFVVLYAGKLDKYKGGYFFAESIQKEIKLNNKNIVFVIIGNTDKEIGNQVEELFQSSENKILRYPTQTYYDLLKFYQMADIAIYPKQCSMSFFEAQACCLPVLFEENEINCQRASSNNALTFTEENSGDFRNKIMEYGNMDFEEFEIMRENARKFIVKNYNFLPVAQKFTDLLIETHDTYHSNLKKGEKK
ncbi:MAG: glycosyltransferase [Aliarcobacter sp.]|nr:glycosyltransferase [Aliarcobacter sp.]